VIRLLVGEMTPAGNTEAKCAKHAAGRPKDEVARRPFWKQRKCETATRHLPLFMLWRLLRNVSLK
jgi:hypothetical protein